MNLKTRISRLERVLSARGDGPRRQFAEECICFPEDEPPHFTWQVEAEMAAAVTCPLHGQRFPRIIARFHIFVPDWIRERQPGGRSFSGSPQYVKAMHASFPPEQWPQQKERYEFTPERKVFLVLRDGTEIYSGGYAADWYHSEIEVIDITAWQPSNHSKCAKRSVRPRDETRFAGAAR